METEEIISSVEPSPSRLPKKTLIIIGAVVGVLLLVVLVFVLIQKSRLDGVGADYSKQAASFAESLPKDPTKYMEYPKLQGGMLAFLSGKYQLAEKQQAVMKADADYMKALHDGMQTEAHTFRLKAHTEDTKNQTTSWTLFSQLSANSDITGQDKKKNVMAYRTHFAASADQYKAFNAALEKLGEAPAAFSDEFSALKDLQKAYIEHLGRCVKDMDAAIAKNDIQGADDIDGKCTNDLETERDEMSNYIVFINTFMNKSYNVDVLAVTAGEVKQHLEAVEKVANAKNAAIYAKLDSKLAVTSAYIPKDYSDTQFLYKGNIIRSLASGLLHEVDQLDTSDATKKVLKDRLNKVRVSFTMYGLGGNEGLSDTEQRGAAGASLMDKLIRIDDRVYVLSENVDDFDKDKVKSEKLRYADCKAVETPEYVKEEVTKLCDNYKLTYEAKEKENAANDKAYGDDSDLHGDELRAALDEYRKYREAVKNYDAATKTYLEAIATKLDKIQDMNKNVQSQLDETVSVFVRS